MASFSPVLAGGVGSEFDDTSPIWPFFRLMMKRFCSELSGSTTVQVSHPEYSQVNGVNPKSADPAIAFSHDRPSSLASHLAPMPGAVHPVPSRYAQPGHRDGEPAARAPAGGRPDPRHRQDLLSPPDRPVGPGLMFRETSFDYAEPLLLGETSAQVAVVRLCRSCG